MSRVIRIEPLTAAAFAPFGDLLDASGTPDKVINQGKCGRFHDRAVLDFADGKAGISIFKGEMETLPLALELVERHPEGSQAFIPMSEGPFLVVVATDDAGTPVNPRAFVAANGQAINFHRGTWHGVLAPLSAPGIFAVVDRIGSGANLEEHWFKEAYTVQK
jgi:ureidoglycolate lyase